MLPGYGGSCIIEGRRRLTTWRTSSTSSYADVVELVDTHALGACASRREGSSPFIRTKVLFYGRLAQLARAHDSHS